MAEYSSPAHPRRDTADARGSIGLALQDVNAGTVVSRIESVLESVLDRLADSQEVSIDFVSRRNLHSKIHAVRREEVRFPGRNALEAKKFARVLLILQLSHDALVSGTILTKRQIFYQHQELFEKQARVDELVDDVALTLRVSRDDLNIVAAAKGAVSGPLTIKLRDGAKMDASTGDLGILIPRTRNIERLNVRSLKWILVVEKDAVFRSLSTSRFWQTSAHGPGGLVTAKGYPDLMTKSFLQLLHMQNPQLPILVLVDFDPDGLNIFRCYRYSLCSSPSGGVDATNAGASWMGVKSSHLCQLTAQQDGSETCPAELASRHARHLSRSGVTARRPISSTDSRDPVAYLSSRDRKSAVDTLAKLSSLSPQDNEASELNRELQVMLMMSVKAEIQWLDDAGDLSSWLDKAIGATLSGSP